MKKKITSRGKTPSLSLTLNNMGVGKGLRNPASASSPRAVGTVLPQLLPPVRTVRRHWCADYLCPRNPKDFRLAGRMR